MTDMLQVQAVTGYFCFPHRFISTISLDCILSTISKLNDYSDSVINIYHIAAV